MSIIRNVLFGKMLNSMNNEPRTTLSFLNLFLSNKPIKGKLLCKMNKNVYDIISKNYHIKYDDLQQYVSFYVKTATYDNVKDIIGSLDERLDLIRNSDEDYNDQFIKFKSNLNLQLRTILLQLQFDKQNNDISSINNVKSNIYTNFNHYIRYIYRNNVCYIWWITIVR